MNDQDVLKAETVGERYVANPATVEIDIPESSIADPKYATERAERRTST